MIVETNCFNVADLTRDEKREIWMRRAGETLANLAAVAGCVPSVLSRHLRSDTMPVPMHARLVEYGVPAGLLPDPFEKKRGPKFRTQQFRQSIPA